ncbi:TetR/AcrR family transcriptional regulator [Ramlibacter henchirensis]|nr:TetR/AcrR family transcriptional regulator [Ramlibacter henchirensis]
MTRQPYQEGQRRPDPRANQKQRTRQALVEAASELVKTGQEPTLAEVADRAKVSRATVYRYFPTPESLLIEVAQVNPAAEPVERWLQTLDVEDPGERLKGLLSTFNKVVLAEQVTLRTALRAYLDTTLENHRRGEVTATVREGRRIRWLDEALRPVKAQLTPAKWRRLRAALALTLGIEAIVVQKDVCQASNSEALATLDWAAQVLLRAALDEAR